MGDLAGQVALVTGSTSGIGEAVARRLVAEGAEVVINSAHSAAAGERLVTELGERAPYRRADISVQAECAELVRTVRQRYGRLDMLVNNAGWTTTIPHTDLEALTDEVFRRTFDVNVMGTWYLTKAAIPLLRAAPAGSVTTVTSAAGVRPRGSSIAYAMSKAALNHMTVLLAKSHGPVRFNAVAPGLVATPWTETWVEQRDNVSRLSPLGRVSTPQEQADVVMACVRSTYMTGAVIVVDGGMSLVS